MQVLVPHKFGGHAASCASQSSSMRIKMMMALISTKTGLEYSTVHQSLAPFTFCQSKSRFLLAQASYPSSRLLMSEAARLQVRQCGMRALRQQQF